MYVVEQVMQKIISCFTSSFTQRCCFLAQSGRQAEWRRAEWILGYVCHNGIDTTTTATCNRAAGNCWAERCDRDRKLCLLLLLLLRR